MQMIRRVLFSLMVSSSAYALDIKQPDAPVSSTMQLYSPSKTLNIQHVANAFGCEGHNTSPELSWKNVPKEAKSLVVTMYDPDAPTGSGFWHWNVYNIDPTVTHIQSNTVPHNAQQLKNDAGTQGYFGACPPVGDQPHRYIFTLYALNTTLDVPNTVTPAVLGFSLNGKVIAKSQFIGYYGR